MKKSPLGQKIAAFFADSSPFMTFVGRIALLVVVNLCFVVCCLPVVTAGAAATAMHAVLLELADLSFDTAFTAYWRAVRRHLRTATLLWLPALALGALLALDWRLLAAQGLTDRMWVLVPLLLAGAVYAFCLLWLFPVLAATGGGVRATAHLAFLLGLRELWRSLLLLALACVPLVMSLLFAQTFMLLWGLWLLVGCAALAFLQSRLTAPVLAAYRPQ